jgi:tetratricopeptide (TPR) repeat protein
MRYFSFLSFALLIVSCTPKLISPKQEAKTLPEKEVQPDTVPSRSQPVSPCKSLTDLSGADRERAETAYVLYKDFLKTGNYETAYQHWKIAYSLAPASNGRVKYHFEDGASIYKHFFQKTTDARLKKLYVDTIMQIYDKKKECFGDEAYINGLKAFDYYYYFPEYSSKDSIFALFTSHMDVKKTNADYFVLNPFARILTDFLLEGKVDVVRGRNYVRQIQQSIINGKATCKGKQCDAWVVVEEYAPIVLESLEGIDGFFDCEYYASKYYALYTSSPDSCDVINLAMARMGRGGCTDTDARFSEVKKAKNDKCYVAPPPLSCAAQGNEEYGKGNYSKAVDAYFQCVENASDAEQKAKYLLLIAKIYYRDLKNYPRARKIALDAAKMKPAWGEPYLLIGNLYASSGPLCGTGRGWESQVVTWPAIDMWMKARTVDSKCNAEATALINRYKQYMPKKEDIFFRNIKAGETYFIPCWIQENTSVRTSD